MAPANARNTKIKISKTANLIELCISGDVQCLNKTIDSDIPELRHIQQLVSSINGRLTLEKEPGKGEKICITILKE